MHARAISIATSRSSRMYVRMRAHALSRNRPPSMLCVCDLQVHERTVEGDFLMLTLRDLLARGRPKGAPALHVCLMSATLDSAVLANYFGESTPRVKFGGRAFPVTTLYLETALSLTRHVVRADADWAVGSRAAQKRRQAQLEQLADGEGQPPPPLTEVEWARRLPEADSAVCRALASLDSSAVNVGLICDLLIWYKSTGGIGEALDRLGAPRASCKGRDRDLGGAVLVFLPGTKEISDVRDALLATPEFGRDDEQREWVLPLHGGLPPDEQRRVFERPPPRRGAGGIDGFRRRSTALSPGSYLPKCVQYNFVWFRL